MKPTIELEKRDEMTEYKAIGLMQSFTSLERAPLPIPIKKTNFVEIVKKPVEPEFDMKNFFDEIIEVVHGSSLTKKELQKKLVETLPQLKRKSEKIKTFLSTYCERGHEKVIRPIISTSDQASVAVDGIDLTKDKKVIRQIVNTDKVVQD